MTTKSSYTAMNMKDCFASTITAVRITVVHFVTCNVDLLRLSMKVVMRTNRAFMEVGHLCLAIHRNSMKNFVETWETCKCLKIAFFWDMTPYGLVEIY
jgi:hypothetical protein